jgi:hypothetical protein
MRAVTAAVLVKFISHFYVFFKMSVEYVIPGEQPQDCFMALTKIS